MIICCSGTHCTGKTTFIDQFINKWPMYKKAQTYRQFVKEKGIKLNENATLEDQKAILHFTIEEAEKCRADKNNNYYILDRGTLDVLAYSAWMYINDRMSYKDLEEIRKLVFFSLSYYDIIFLFTLRYNSLPLVADEMRTNLDPAYQAGVDKLFREFLESYIRRDQKIFPLTNCPALIELEANTTAEKIAFVEQYLDAEGNPFEADETQLQKNIIDFASAQKESLEQFHLASLLKQYN